MNDVIQKLNISNGGKDNIPVIEPTDPLELATEKVDPIELVSRASSAKDVNRGLGKITSMDVPDNSSLEKFADNNKTKKDDKLLPSKEAGLILIERN